MKKITIKKPGCIETKEVELPRRKKGEVLVKIQCVSLCGSDYKLFAGTYDAPHAYPLVMGHEWSGTVVETSEEETCLKPGDRVTGECSKWCGTCPNCREDKNLCEHIEKFGITRDGFAIPYQVVDSRYLHKAKGMIAYDILALAEPLAVALHGIRKIQRMEGFGGKKAAIIGGGSIGVLIYLWLTDYYKLNDVTIFEKNATNAEYLRETFGAEICTGNLERNEDSYESLYRKQKYDVVFEASGTSQGIQEAVELLKIRGYLCLYGLGKDYQMDMKKIVLKGLYVTGTIGGSEEFDTAIQFIEKHQERIRKLITKRYSSTEIEKALTYSAKESEPVLKQQIYFREDEKNSGKGSYDRPINTGTI